jgi:hypothetical protein
MCGFIQVTLRKLWRNKELPEERKKEYINKRRRYSMNVNLGIGTSQK